MDEELVEEGVPSVGETLRAARKKKKLSLEDIAARTRIPLRHLESLESSDWANLPAPTYSVGFAKSYAAVVDLDRDEIGERLRGEMGGQRQVPAAAEVFEPVDPARAMPKALVIGAIVAVLLLVGLMSWINNRSLNEGSAPEANSAATTPPAQRPAAPPAAAIAQGPVVLSALEPLWMSVYEKGGQSYFAGILKPGANFIVPPTASAPMLGTAKPEALKIMIGTTVAPPVGPPGKQVKDVSLLPADLLKAGAVQSAPAAPPPVVAAPSPAQRRAAPARRAAPPVAKPPPLQPTPQPVPTAPPPDNVSG